MIKILRTPGQKHNQRVDITPEERAFSIELGRRINDGRYAKSSLYVISDTMDYTRHMADGKYYDSKSKFRRATKAAGCIEVGNEAGKMLKPRKIIEPDRRERREHIKQAIYQLKNGQA